jgi:hypothetical protein
MSTSCTRSVRFELKRNSASGWTSSNPILLAGEPGTELDTGQMKIGNGITPWNLLPYVGNGVTGGGGGGQGPTGPTGPMAPAIGFDGGNAASVYSMGPVFDCGRAE